ncbi:uncharacterized protein J4E79_008592 [Alternaria viburni]|uniref:uncharacterized protein n=1 Tax=Alternaria viburni TaxID=566460 RepID=UPI0020C21DC0|nr:uncharacterized protein J4E79_008592 [Alternaria viburni]KAI4653079.1 hypothetical protein J4E79_008592 [Alternaria viburni]
MTPQQTTPQQTTPKKKTPQKKTSTTRYRKTKQHKNQRLSEDPDAEDDEDSFKIDMSDSTWQELPPHTSDAFLSNNFASSVAAPARGLDGREPNQEPLGNLNVKVVDILDGGEYFVLVDWSPEQDKQLDYWFNHLRRRHISNFGYESEDINNQEDNNISNLYAESGKIYNQEDDNISNFGYESGDINDQEDYNRSSLYAESGNIKHTAVVDHIRLLIESFGRNRRTLSRELVVAESPSKASDAFLSDNFASPVVGPTRDEMKEKDIMRGLCHPTLCFVVVKIVAHIAQRLVHLILVVPVEEIRGIRGLQYAK